MCGIFGRLGASDQIDRLRMLAACNATRGDDSYGLYVRARKKKEGFTQKGVGSIITALAESTLRPEWFRGEIVLGHTRAASKGSVSIDNAHPFRYGDILGAHNGCLSDFEEQRREFAEKVPEQSKVLSKMEVDSMLIIWALANLGTEALEDINCWAGCWWVNLAQLDRLYLWCSSADLAYAFDGDCFYFSSDEDHLKAVGLKPTETKDDTLYEIPLDNPTRMTSRKLAALPYIRYTTYQGVQSGCCGQARGLFNETKDDPNDPADTDGWPRSSANANGIIHYIETEGDVWDTKGDQVGTKDDAEKLAEAALEDAAKEESLEEGKVHHTTPKLTPQQNAYKWIGSCPECGLNLFMNMVTDSGFVSCPTCEWEGLWSDMKNPQCKAPVTAPPALPPGDTQAETPKAGEPKDKEQAA